MQTSFASHCTADSIRVKHSRRLWLYIRIRNVIQIKRRCGVSVGWPQCEDLQSQRLVDCKAASFMQGLFWVETKSEFYSWIFMDPRRKEKVTRTTPPALLTVAHQVRDICRLPHRRARAPDQVWLWSLIRLVGIPEPDEWALFVSVWEAWPPTATLIRLTLQFIQSFPATSHMVTA